MPMTYTDPRSLILICMVIAIAYLLAKLAERSKRSSAVTIFFLVIVLSSFCGLRGTSTGRDTYGYYSDLMMAMNGNTRVFQYYEYGYRIVAELILKMTGSIQPVFFLFAFFTISLIIIRMWEMRDRILFSNSVLLFCCTTYYLLFSGFRQWLAASIVFYATRYIEKKRYFVFFLLIGIACSFHTTALIGIAIFAVNILFSRQKKYNGFKKFAVVTIGGVMILLSPVLINYITESTRYSMDRYRGEQDIGFMIVARLLLFVLLVISTIHNHSKTKASDIIPNRLPQQEHQEFVIQNYFLYISMCLLGGVYGSSINRMSWYFMPYEPIMFSSKSLIQNTRYRICVKLIIVMIVFYSFYCFAIRGIQNLTPYRFFWEN